MEPRSYKVLASDKECYFSFRVKLAVESTEVNSAKVYKSVEDWYFKKHGKRIAIVQIY